MDTLRSTAIVVLGSALAAGAVMARSRAPLTAHSLAIAAPSQVIHPDPPVVPPPPPSDAAVVEAAREARAAKDAKRAREAAKRLVWNDDNIPRVPRDITVVGRTEANPGSESAAADGAAPAAPGEAAGPQAKPTAAAAAAAAAEKNKEELTRVRERAADLEKETELAQRQFELDQNQISQNPDYANDHAGQNKLRSESSEVQAKEHQLGDLKRQISDLESKTRP
jgi:hypothetical protein